MQVLLHTPHFDLAIVWRVNMQRHVVGIHRTQARMLDEPRVAAVQVCGQTEQDTQDAHDLLRPGVLGEEGTNVVQQRCVLQPCALPLSQPVQPDSAGAVE